MNERMFFFRSVKEMLTISNAIALNDPAVNAEIERIKINCNNRRTKDDGFKPGYDANFGVNVTDYGHYKRLCKEKNLVELGNDYGHIKESTSVGGYCNTPEFVASIKEQGIELSGNEEAAIISGEFFDSSKCDA